jgi:hypothetical protein
MTLGLAVVYGLSACLVLYAILGCICFHPTSASYMMESQASVQDEWFKRVEDLQAEERDPSRDANASFAQARFSSSSPGNAQTTPLRLVGPSSRRWFFGCELRWPMAHAFMQPWTRCWLVLVRHHFPSIREQVLPEVVRQQLAANQSSVQWRHVFHVRWSGPR